MMTYAEAYARVVAAEDALRARLELAAAGGVPDAPARRAEDAYAVLGGWSHYATLARLGGAQLAEAETHADAATHAARLAAALGATLAELAAQRAAAREALRANDAARAAEVTP